MAITTLPPGPSDATNSRPCAVTGVGVTQVVSQSNIQSAWPSRGSYPFTRPLPLTTIWSGPSPLQTSGVAQERATSEREVFHTVLPVALSTASRKSSASVSQLSSSRSWYRIGELALPQSLGNGPSGFSQSLRPSRSKASRPTDPKYT